MLPPTNPPDAPKPPSPQAGSTPGPAHSAPVPPVSVAGESTVDPSKLTPEEQMALYEKDLKENDWGHQPC